MYSQICSLLAGISKLNSGQARNEATKMLKKEEYAAVLDFLPQGKAGEAKREPVAQIIGTTYFTLLEVVSKPGTHLSLGEKVYIGKGVRDHIDHIKGRIAFNELTSSAQDRCRQEVRSIVVEREVEFISFLNRTGALNIRVHTLEMLPSIGKKHLMAILNAREQKPFANFADVHDRVSSIGKIEDIFVERVILELKGDEKYYLFAKAPSREFERY